jgi:hypothetical protein
MGTAIEIPSDSLTIGSPADEGFERTTRFTVAGGSGTYGRTIHANRTFTTTALVGGMGDCYGPAIPDTVTTIHHVDANFRFKDSYDDYGGELDVQVSPRAHIGMRAGRIDETVSYLGSDISQAVIDTLFKSVRIHNDTFSNYYFNPFFAMEKEKMGWGAGVIYSTNRLWTDKTREFDDYDDATLYPTGHLRLGQLNKAYMKFSLWEGVPVYSGGGKFVAGVGVRPAPWLDLFGGFASGGPFTRGGTMVSGNLDVGRHLTAGVNLRLSSGVDEVYWPHFSESAASVSLTYKLITH